MTRLNDQTYVKPRWYSSRQRGLTPPQRKVWDENWHKYGKNYKSGLKYGFNLDLAEWFGNDHPVVIEIGFGNGDQITALAKSYPQTNFIGVEIYRGGQAELLKKIVSNELENVRIVACDVRKLFNLHLADGSLQKVIVLFPDPWMKGGDEYRRLMSSKFISVIARRLNPTGSLMFATDHSEYADYVLDQVAEIENVVCTSKRRKLWRIITRYESKAIEEGRGIQDFEFKMKSALRRKIQYIAGIWIFLQSIAFFRNKMSSK